MSAAVQKLIAGEDIKGAMALVGRAAQEAARELATAPRAKKDEALDVGQFVGQQRFQQVARHV